MRTTAAAIALAVLTAPAQAEGWSPLIEPAALAELAAAQETVILDIRATKTYGTGHVDGAVSVPYPAWRGPLDNPGALPSDGSLSLLLSEAGVEPGLPVVITYEGRDASDFGAAARVYWTLKSAGLDQIAILNGGLSAWTAAGLPLSRTEDANFPSDHSFAIGADWMIDREGVEAVLAGEREAIMLDARPHGFFAGREKHSLAAFAGTLGGALNLPHSGWFAGAGGSRLEVTPEAAQEVARRAGHVPGGSPIVSFCNTGHWAATNWFVLSEIAGIEGVRLYPESMVGWTRAGGRIALAAPPAD